MYRGLVPLTHGRERPGRRGRAETGLGVRGGFVQLPLCSQPAAGLGSAAAKLQLRGEAEPSGAIVLVYFNHVTG